MSDLWPLGCALLCAAPAVTAADPVWDWQLSAPFDFAAPAAVMDLDPDTHDRALLRDLKARGSTLICYVSVGTVEEYRADAAAFPAEVIGKRYDDWPEERFLDIRRHDVVLPIMRTRFRTCRAAGFDAVEPDNLDLHWNDTGFDLTARDVVVYVQALADIAHDLGLEIGQKNVPDLTGDLIGTLDFALVESCFDQGWCDQMLPYVRARKPVYAAEYTDRPDQFAQACLWGAENGIAFIRKDRDLTGYVQTCPDVAEKAQ